MRSQAVLLVSVLVISSLLILLLLFVPVHQDAWPAVKVVEEGDKRMVAKILGRE